MEKVENYIMTSLEKLRTLGVSGENEEEIKNSILQMPQDMLEDLEKEQIFGLILDDMGRSGYDWGTGTYHPTSDRIFSFDVEVADPEWMYTPFLQAMNDFTKEEVKITDITETYREDGDREEDDVKTVAFRLNGAVCEKELPTQYDWFNTEIIAYLNQVLAEQKAEKYFYITSDGWQNCVVFYSTPEWAEQFGQIFEETQLERP